MSTSASALLSRMVSTYANARTYADHGQKRTLFMHGANERLDRQLFATSFERPARFRFEFISSNGTRHVVGRSDPGLARHQGPEGDWEPLDFLLGKLAGVSGGTSWMIPCLLLPEEFRWRYVLVDPVLEGEEAISGSRCHRVTGLFGKEKMTVYRC